MKKPLLGVIRWDAMNAQTDCDKKSLSPLKWHDRAPYFLDISGKDKVSGNENTQQIIDEQILYAAQAGIDYWAFISNESTNPDDMEVYARQRYLQSPYKDRLGFCVILHKYGSPESWKERTARLVEWFQDPSYVRVMNGRPLVYFFSLYDMENALGPGNGVKTALQTLKDACSSAGVENPYYAICAHNNFELAKHYGQTYGIDAVSAYSYIGNDENRKGYSFDHLAAQNILDFKRYSTACMKSIPGLGLGFDQRCRWECPPPWGAFESPYYEQGTPEEIAAHIRNGMDYVNEHPDECEANTILIYAWNEFCEGSWLCPTHAEGTKRLDAIRSMLDQYCR